MFFATLTAKLKTDLVSCYTIYLAVHWFQWKYFSVFKIFFVRFCFHVYKRVDQRVVRAYLKSLPHYSLFVKKLFSRIFALLPVIRLDSVGFVIDYAIQHTIHTHTHVRSHTTVLSTYVLHKYTTHRYFAPLTIIATSIFNWSTEILLPQIRLTLSLTLLYLN